jgi:hypothetical protein
MRESGLISSEPSSIRVCITKYNNIDGRKAGKPGVCGEGFSVNLDIMLARFRAS